MKNSSNINHNPPIDPQTLYKMFCGNEITSHRDNAKTLLILSCILGALATVATTASALNKSTDGAGFILWLISGALYATTANLAILYKQEKKQIAQLQKNAYQHIRYKGL